MADYQDSDLLGDSGKVDTAPLDVDDDLFDVLKEVTPVAAKWKAVGLALRLKRGELDSIAASHPHDTEECLSEMLTQWLRKNYNVKKFGEPSWQRLVEAVGDPAGGANPALANQIAGKHRVEKTTGGHSPTLRELDQLPSVATMWYRLGLQLGVRADDLDMIENNYPRDADMCKIKMFAEWRRGDTNPTYEKLVRALAAVGKRKLAESVCSDRGISSSVLDATAATKLHQSHGHATGQQQITIREIQWRTGKDTPESMERGAAVSHGKMAYFNSDGSTSVYSYDAQGQLWQRLPDCHSQYSALVMANNKLTTVGGIDQYGRPTNSLASLTGEGKDSKWAELFPRMPTARYHLAAVCRGKNVIAAGGWGDSGRRLSTVEILDTDLRQWSSAASLPRPMMLASITMCGDLLYLLGGFDQNGQTLSVLTSSITDLQTANQPAVWRRAADAPYYGSTAVSIGGQLLAIGGEYKKTSAIVAYDPTSDSWQDMGHMTTPRWRPLVALLPSNELIVAGGFEEKLK